jgi:hypothetical protein
VTLRYGLFALSILALAACSTSGNNNSNANPLAGVSIIVPTPSPAPTPTPLPTATPSPSASITPTPGPTNVIVDGGFETEGAAAVTFSSWLPCSYAVPGTYGTPILTSGITSYIVSASDPSFTVPTTPVTTVAPSVHGGTYGVLTYTGDAADTVTFPPSTAPVASQAGENGICQTFVVPANASLNLYVNEGGNESGISYGDQEATLFAGSNTSGTPISVFKELNTQVGQSSNSATNGYVLRGPYALTTPAFGLSAGQTVTLYIGTYDNGPSTKYGPYMFVDDVSVVGTPVSASAVRRRVR